MMMANAHARQARYLMMANACALKASAYAHQAKSPTTTGNACAHLAKN